MNTPPPDTRAFGRSRVIRHLMETKNKRYVIDWDSVYVDRERSMELRNPFHTYKKEAEKFAAKL
jgi:proteasome accessory factor A